MFLGVLVPFFMSICKIFPNLSILSNLLHRNTWEVHAVGIKWDITTDEHHFLTVHFSFVNPFFFCQSIFILSIHFYFLHYASLFVKFCFNDNVSPCLRPDNLIPSYHNFQLTLIVPQNIIGHNLYLFLSSASSITIYPKHDQWRQITNDRC